MTISRRQLCILLQAICLIPLFLYQSLWLASLSTEAAVTGFYTSRNAEYGDMDFVAVTYSVNNSLYTTRFPGDALNHHITSLRIRYLTFCPSVTRMDGFAGNWLFCLLIYFIWFFATSLLFLIPNDIVPRRHLFLVSNCFPWIQLKLE